MSRSFSASSSASFGVIGAVSERHQVDRGDVEVQEPRESLIRMWIDRGSSGGGARAEWPLRTYPAPDRRSVLRHSIT
jgi:hypothetical protein